MLPRKMDFSAIEEKWQRKWEEWGIYRFDWNRQDKPTFSIDTPPPYPSGEFHMGNVLNWTYFDIIARYKRMQGYNVYFPQGWDCHGLQIERRAEKEYGVKKDDISTAEFIDLCKEFVDKYINVMKSAIKKMGCSIDWTTEYKTMNPDYWRRTQLSFILLFKNDYIYQGTHPVNWCPSCETAIADAEVNYDSRQGKLYNVRFPLEKGGHLTIATTRPELVPACVTVAVHPKDKRFAQHVGQTVRVPTTNRKVKIVADNMVDREFGTGAVMICTYGDKADVKTVAKLRLQTVSIIAKDGRMNQNAGKYEGFTVQEAKKAIVEDFRELDLLAETQPIQQEVGLCDRCGTPIEVLETKQWFMKTRQLTGQVEEAADTIKWYPDYMKTRLVDWAKSLDWDWVISRQRVFGTPIPIWYCGNCGDVVLAEESRPPVDPKREKPRAKKCQNCGHRKFVGERDVFDTWMDSSITCAVHAGWPDKSETDLQKLFPADLHPSGIDIIRTWAYYLVVRHLALFGVKPFKTSLINGMVLGSDGRKMSKSLGNYIATPEVFEKFGADTSRQWAAGGGTTGSDIPFRWPDVEYARRFLVKLWNASRFAGLMLKDYQPSCEQTLELTLLDRWLMAKMKRATLTVTSAFENCQFNVAIEEIRRFAWRDLCDNYLEAIKHRLYRGEVYGEGRRKAAQHALYTALVRVLTLFAPISPHITEEIFQTMFSLDTENISIHLTSWPRVEKDEVDEKAIEEGDLLMAVIGEIRREKARKRMSLNSLIEELTIYGGTEEVSAILSSSLEDIGGTCKIEKINILPQKGHGVEVKGYTDVTFVGV